MKKNNLLKAALFGLFAISLMMPISAVQAADPAGYKACIKSCQQQYANCYKQTKNRAQCQARQADCSKGCASYLSSLKSRILAMVTKNKETAH